VNDLATSLDLPYDMLDRSDAGLDAMEGLISYLGEVLCQKTGGRRLGPRLEDGPRSGVDG